MSQIRNDLEVYLEQISKVPLLSAIEEKEVAWRIINEECPQAKDLMIRANLRLVVSISKQFTRSGIPLLDLVNEGNLGLIRAVERFDPAYGNRFSTYATWWIKKTIKRKLMNGRQPMHVPAYMVQRMAKWARVVRELEEELGRCPTSMELARAMKVPRSKLDLIRRTMASLERSVTTSSSEDEGRTHPLDNCPSPSSEPGQCPVERRDDIEKVRKLLDCFDPVTARILRMRFGLDGQPALTLKEIGKHLGITRERVRQIEHQALRRLKNCFDNKGVEIVGKHTRQAS